MREKALLAAHKAFCEDWNKVTKKQFCLNLIHEMGWGMVAGKQIKINDYLQDSAKKYYEYFLNKLS